MKYDRFKSFGYPVLQTAELFAHKDELDYQAGNIDFMVQPKIDTKTPDLLMLNYEIYLTEPVIIQKIALGDLALILRVECGLTFYAENFNIEGKGQLLLPMSDLGGDVSLSIFVVAAKQTTMEGSSLNEDFGYDAFGLEDGNVVAWTQPQRITVDKKQFRGLRSLVSLEQSENIKKFGEVIVDASEDYIKITVKPDFYQKCKEAEGTGMGRAMLTHSLYIPIFVELLMNLRNSQENSTETRKWETVIRHKLDSKNINLDDNTEIYNLVQNLFNFPIYRLAKQDFSVE